MRQIKFINHLAQDIHFGLRLLWRSPSFAAVAIITIALGIGANTAIFSIVNTVLLRPLPYPEPNRLVKIVVNNPGVGLRDVPFSFPEFEDLRSKSSVFEEISVVWPSSGNLTGGQQPERLELLAVSPNYFSMLGAKPEIGRLFDSQDITPGFAQAVVISDGLWRRSYGGDPNVLGRNLRIDNDPYTIVGVLPPEFRHPGRTVATDVEVWATAGFSADPFSPGRSQREIAGAIGRLKRGLSREQAQAGLDILARSVQADHPSDYSAQAKWSIEITPLQQSMVGDVRPLLWVLMGAVSLIILIASVNIANLLMARASGRQREIAIRLALGATRGRLIRQMLTESILLSLIAGLAGVLAARGALGFILRFVPAKIPRLSEVSIDWVVLGFALLISILTGLLFGLAPALQSVKGDISAAVKEGAKGSGTGLRTSRLRDLLIVSELALAVVLMIGAGLLLRTFWRLLGEDPGFNPSKVVVASLWLPVPNDPKSDAYGGIAPQSRFVREALRRVGSIPGIELASITSSLPAAGRTSSSALSIEDRPADSGQDLRAEVIRVSPEYFKAVQAALVRGRYFSDSDEKGKPDVAIVDETMARQYWPSQDPIGRRLRLGRETNPPWLTVVGIIRDIKHDGLDKDGVPHVYISVYQRPGRAMSVVARTSLTAATLEPQIRQAIQSVDASLPIFNIRTMNEVLDVSLAPRRFSAELVGVFAGVALLLAAIGIYGLLAYLVGQRAHEIGVRMALGAQKADILRLFIIKGALLASLGILLGVVIAAIASPAIASLLYGVRATDPVVFTTVPLVLLAVSLMASYVPARRATTVDPIIALREG